MNSQSNWRLVYAGGLVYASFDGRTNAAQEPSCDVNDTAVLHSGLPSRPALTLMLATPQVPGASLRRTRRRTSAQPVIRALILQPL
jgi:hypothetical protein